MKNFLGFPKHEANLHGNRNLFLNLMLYFFHASIKGPTEKPDDF